MSETKSKEELLQYIEELETKLAAAESREEQLRERVELLEHVFNLLDVGEFNIDLKTGVADVSERWWNLLGYVKGEHDEHLDNMKQLHYPSDWEKGWELIAAHLQGETPIYENELRYLSKDNKWLWFKVIGKVFRRDEEGKPMFFAGAVQNIMWQKQLVEDLEKTRAELNKQLSLKDSELSEISKNLYDAQQEIQSLAGILPICSCCKKIRDDEGYWEQLEAYIQNHSEAQFSHGLCENCIEDLYRDEGWFQRYKEKLMERKQQE